MVLGWWIKMLVQVCAFQDSKATSELSPRRICEQMAVSEIQLGVGKVGSFPMFSSWRNNLPLQWCPVFMLPFIPSSLHVCVIQNIALALWGHFFFSLYIYIYLFIYFLAGAGFLHFCLPSFPDIILLPLPWNTMIHRTGMLLQPPVRLYLDVVQSEIFYITKM